MRGNGIPLKDIKPPVWRRLFVPDCSLEELHEVIQVVMGWENYHLYGQTYEPRHFTFDQLLSGMEAGVQFVNVAREAGLTAKTVYGSEKRNRYLMETTGCGCAFFDYDNDGWLDIFLVNGSRFEGGSSVRDCFRSARPTLADWADVCRHGPVLPILAGAVQVPASGEATS